MKNWPVACKQKNTSYIREKQYMSINRLIMKMSSTRKIFFFIMSQGSLNTKIKFLGQQVCSKNTQNDDLLPQSELYSGCLPGILTLEPALSKGDDIKWIRRWGHALFLNSASITFFVCLTLTHTNCYGVSLKKMKTLYVCYHLPNRVCSFHCSW